MTLWERLQTKRVFHTMSWGKPRTEVLRYLDDSERKKRYPGDRTRYLPGEYILHTEPLKEFEVPELDPRLCWALVRFHRSPHGGLSLSRSEGGEARLFNPWSASKVMSIALASLSLRDSGSGLTGSVRGLPLGDLVTLICSYDVTRAFGTTPLNSNNAASYFHSLIGPPSPTRQLRARLGIDERAAFETSYGTTFRDDPRVPRPQGYTGGMGRGKGQKLMNARILASGFCSALIQMNPEDLKILLYGAELSRWYSTYCDKVRVEMGGMCADPSIYVQSAFDLNRIEQESGGRWRIFSKIGYGPATRERGNEFVLLSYFSLPVIDATGGPVANLGREGVLAARFHGEGLADVEADELFAENIVRLLGCL